MLGKMKKGKMIIRIGSTMRKGRRLGECVKKCAGGKSSLKDMLKGE